MNGTLNFLRGMNLYTTFCKTDIKKLLTTLQNAYSSLFKTDFPQVMQSVYHTLCIFKCSLPTTEVCISHENKNNIMYLKKSNISYIVQNTYHIKLVKNTTNTV